MKVRFLFSILIVCLPALTRADFTTVGVYDPDDDPHHNQVDQSGVYDSHTGTAGPGNILSLATFQALIGPAFAADAGGVISGESQGDSLPSSDIITASFGVSQTKSAVMSSTSGDLSLGSGGGSGNRLPISGDRRFAKGSATSDFVFTIDAVTGGAPEEHITHFGGTLLERDNRATIPMVTATFTDGSTVTATADMVGDDASPNSKDTFFGFAAPRGLGIVSVEFDLDQWVHLDDIAFITSAFKPDAELAWASQPENGATDIPRDLSLSWTPGEWAEKHNVYVGANWDDVNEASLADARGTVVGQDLDVNAFDPGRLAFGQTYYWRVDEVNGAPDRAVFKGEVWSFTVEPEAVPVVPVGATASAEIPGSEAVNTINGSGLDALDQHGTSAGTMWIAPSANPWIQFEFDQAYKLHEMLVWNANQTIESFVPFGIKDVTIDYSVDGVSWQSLEGVVTLAQGPGSPTYVANTAVDLGGLTAKLVKLQVASGYGAFGQMSLSEVRFTAIPVAARELLPADGAFLSDLDVTLAWRNGREANEHQVYLDANAALVEAADPLILVSTFPAEGAYDSYTATDLMLSETYHWKIVEVNEAQAPAAHESAVQRFTLPDYLVVDAMEDYRDADGHKIWEVWLDGSEFGIEDPANGSTVGADPRADDYLPTTGLGRSQSLAVWINVFGEGGARAEATRLFDRPQNWQRAGITTLSLVVQRGSVDTGGSLYVRLNGDGKDAGTKVPLVDNSVYPPGFNPGWVRYNVDLTALDVSSVTSLSAGIEGAKDGDVFYVDDIELHAQAPALMTLRFVAPIIEAESGAISAPFEILSTIPTASGGQFIMVPNGGGNASEAPAAPDDGRAVYTINIPADGDYVIGLLGLSERAGDGGDDSFWLTIPDAVLARPTWDRSGWVRCGGIFGGGEQDEMVWDLVRDWWFNDGEDQDPVVFALTAGPHELQISRREDGTGLDAIAILAVD